MGETSWGGDREIDAIEEITDAKREYLSTDIGRGSVSGRGRADGWKI